MLVILRAPSLKRSICTIRSSARDSCCRMARIGKSMPGHQHHALDTGDRVAGSVGVAGGHRPVMAGVHRLQHVQRLGAAGLADDDPIRSHAE